MDDPGYDVIDFCRDSSPISVQSLHVLPTPGEPDKPVAIAPPPVGNVYCAPFPFNRSSADLILRCSDGAKFYVRSPILLEASPVIEGMISRASSTPHPSPLVLAFDEHSTTMEALLRICYPILNPHLDGPLGEVEAILKAAVKYQMEFPIAVLTAELLSRATHAPLSVWAAACRSGLETLALRAAEHTFPAAVLSFERDSDLEGIPAWQLYRLREFWRLKGQVAEDFSILTVPSATCPSSVPLDMPDPAFRSLSYENTDLVIYSEDGGEHRAHSDIVSAAIPSLKERIDSAIAHVLSVSVPHLSKVKLKHNSKMRKSKDGSRRASSESHPLATITLDEDGDTIGALLELCYPGGVVSSCEPVKLAAIMLAANKYQMRCAFPALRARWTWLSAADPLRAYLAAATRGLQEAAAESASHALKNGLDGLYVQELETVPTRLYYRLVVYYDQCRAVARNRLSLVKATLASSASGIGITYDPPSGNAGEGGGGCMPGDASKGSDQGEAEEWFANYINALTDIASCRPGNFVPAQGQVYEEATAAGRWCSVCQTLADKLSLIEQALKEVQESISAVPFAL